MVECTYGGVYTWKSVHMKECKHGGVYTWKSVQHKRKTEHREKYTQRRILAGENEMRGRMKYGRRRVYTVECTHGGEYT